MAGRPRRRARLARLNAGKDHPRLQDLDLMPGVDIPKSGYVGAQPGLAVGIYVTWGDTGETKRLATAPYVWAASTIVEALRFAAHRDALGLGGPDAATFHYKRD